MAHNGQVKVLGRVRVARLKMARIFRPLEIPYPEEDFLQVEIYALVP